MNTEEILSAPWLADFKFLLPLGKQIRVLVANTRGQTFLPHLAADVGRIDVWVTPNTETYWRKMRTVLKLSKVRLVTVPDSDYDLVFTDHYHDVLPVREAGMICRFYKGRDIDSKEMPLPIWGIWAAWPDWPRFRILIPDNVDYQQTLEKVLLSPTRSFLSRAARSGPKLFKRVLPRQGLIIHRRIDGREPPSFCERLASALAKHQELIQLKDLPPARWLVSAGQAGKTEPVSLFTLNEKGSPEFLIKCARFPGTSQLQEEEESLRYMVNRLGTELARQVSKPLAKVNVEGRWALAYHCESGYPFRGLRWRLIMRSNVARALTRWLVALAYKTAHPLSENDFIEKHCAPLEHLLKQGVLPGELRESAENTLTTLSQHRLRAFSVLEHGDLGYYNLRILDKNGHDFRIVGWGSANWDGTPLGDLCYLLSSMQASPKLAAQCLNTYLVNTGYPATMVFPLWLSYMARHWKKTRGVPATIKGYHPSDNPLLRMTPLVRHYAAALGDSTAR